MTFGEFINKYVFPFGISFIFLMIGFLMNTSVMYFNDGRMPIIADYGTSEINDTTHFTITNRTEVKAYYLGDIFKIRLNKKNTIIFFSIGDIFLYLGLGAAISVGLISVMKVIKTRSIGNEGYDFV